MQVRLSQLMTTYKLMITTGEKGV